jgi:hypothetical protein
MMTMIMVINANKISVAARIESEVYYIILLSVFLSCFHK